jgi:hypothetical protein
MELAPESRCKSCGSSRSCTSNAATDTDLLTSRIRHSESASTKMANSVSFESPAASQRSKYSDMGVTNVASNNNRVPSCSSRFTPASLSQPIYAVWFCSLDVAVDRSTRPFDFAHICPRQMPIRGAPAITINA